MNKTETQAFAMLGPLGSGKTTTLNNMLDVLHPEEVEQTRIVVNDVGEANVDYQRLIGGGAQEADIRALTAGCIGCSDVSQFREIVEAAKEDGVRFLLIEPTGIAPGNEIAEVVEAAGLPFSALTLVDVKHFAVHQLYDVMPSQLLVASHVGLTHVEHLDGNIWEDDAMQEVLAFIGQHAPGVQIDAMRAGIVDRNFVELLLDIKPGMRRKLGRIAVGHSCDAGCQHHHEGHHHGSNIHAFSFTTDAKDPEELIKTLNVFPGSHLVRAKGVIGGYSFDLVGDDMTVQEIDDPKEPVVNLIYVGEAPDFSGEERLFPLHVHQEASDKKTVVGSVRKLSSAQRETLITDHLTYYPQNIINVAGGQVVPINAAPKLTVIQGQGGTSTVSELPKVTQGPGEGYMDMKKKWIDAFEREYLTGILERHQGNVSASAREAKLDRSNFLRLLRRHGLKAQVFRTEEQNVSAAKAA
jgi:G3E family GTPase